MADSLPTTKYYRALGGVNLKASQYEMSTAQFLNIRNMDFDVPNSLQKRPGSTYAIGSGNGTSGPISSLYEFVKLTGESYVVASSDTAIFYVANNAFTLLETGWNNGQPVDYLTFVNKLWMSNGGKWRSWDGNTLLPVGLPLSINESFIISNGTTLGYLFVSQPFASSAGSYFLVNGATMQTFNSGGTTVSRAVFLAYTYIRADGYQGPADFQNTAKNIVQSSPGNANEFFNSANNLIVGGFTIPSGYGISGVNVWFAYDTVYNTGTPSTQQNIPGVGLVNVGNLGWLTQHANKNFVSFSLKPGADLTKFWLYTTIAGSSLFATTDGAGSATYWAATIILGASFGSYEGIVPSASLSFSGMIGDFFSTFTPKYMEINQNTMFVSGFSQLPSQVAFSDIGQPEFYEPQNSFEARTNDGDRIYGMKTYNNQMLVMKEHSFHRLIGDSPDNYQLIQVSDQYGCLSDRTILAYDQKLLWLDKKGILEFTGANFAIISGPVESMFRRMNINAAKENSCGIHHIYRSQLWWGIPIDGATQNNLTIVYDYSIGAWTFFDGFNPASFAYIKSGLSKPTAWRGDYSGLVHYTGESFFSDSSRSITCLIQPRWENQGGENQQTLWRRFFLDVAPAVGLTGTLNGQVFSSYDSSTIQATFTMYQNQFQSRAEMGVQGKAVSVQVSHSSASLPLLINGYAWANRGLRNV